MQIPCLKVADIELPREVSGLYDLAYNFWWSWSSRARRLFNTIDPVAWSEYHNPVQMLINVDPVQWEQLLQSETFLASYNSVMKEFRAYVGETEETWFHRAHGASEKNLIAYFSSEYGLHECFNIYSGGLGVLSGDHCKSASDLGLPFVAVGLLYRRGYFRQAVDADGRQQHIYPQYDFTRLPVRPVAGPTQRPVIIEVPMPGRMVYAKVWLAMVGRVPLLLLDTDIPQNDPSDRPISGLLYVRGREMRLVQEMILGVGGVRALRELGLDPTVWHLNEGHSAFLQFERLCEFSDRDGGHRPEHYDELRRNSVFTTHTPVPAGNEQFDAHLVRGYLEGWVDEHGMDVGTILQMGKAEPDAQPQSSFNLTALAVRTAARTNGVSRLHGEVSSAMWSHLFDASAGPAPVGSITNGIHTLTWLGSEMLELFNRHLGLDWMGRLALDSELEAVRAIPDEEIWQAHQTQKERLARFVRVRQRAQIARHGAAPGELRAVSGQFRVDRLTIGFARRFATYKRADLLFRDLHRVRALFGSEEQPVQIVIAGKAHPADHPGQELIQHIYQLSQSGPLKGRIFFLEDYDMRVGRVLVQGVDVWLNTPRRPMEASGTSGQKSAANGGLNLSVLDGWWPEAYDGTNGFAIGGERAYEDPDRHDLDDALSLYDVLETDVVPTFYQRDEHGVPHEWVARMKNAIATCLPRFSTSRMVRDYAEEAYLPVSRDKG